MNSKTTIILGLFFSVMLILFTGRSSISQAAKLPQAEIEAAKSRLYGGYFEQISQIGSDEVDYIALNHRGSAKILAVLNSGVIYLYDTDTFKVVQTISSYPIGSSDKSSNIVLFEWAPDGVHLATIDSSNILRIWYAESAKLVSWHILNGFPSSLAWNPESDVIITSSCGPFAPEHIVKWDPYTTGGPIGNIDVGDCYRNLTWSAEGYIAGIKTDVVFIINEAIYEFPKEENIVHAIAWSPSGTRLVSLETDKLKNENKLVLRDIETANTTEYIVTNKELVFADKESVFTNSSLYNRLIWASADSVIFGLKDSRDGTDKIMIWNITRKTIQELPGFVGSSLDWSFLNEIYSISDNGIITKMNAPSGEVITYANPKGPTFTGFTWSPSGKYVAVHGEQGFIWDVNTSQPVVNFEPFISAIGWSSDEKKLAYAKGKQVIGFSRGRRAAILTELESFVRNLSWSPSMDYIAINSSSFNLLHVPSGKLFSPFTEKEVLAETGQISRQVKESLWLSDGNHLLTVRTNSNNDTLVQLWDAENGESKTLLEEEHVIGLAVSPNTNEFIYLNEEGVLTLSSINLDRAVKQRRVAPRGWDTEALAWSHDGQYLAVGVNDKDISTNAKIAILDANSFEELDTFNARTSSIEKLEWSPSELLLASLGRDRVIRIWGPTSTTANKIAATKSRNPYIVNGRELSSIVNWTTTGNVYDFMSNAKILSPSEDQIITRTATFHWDTNFSLVPNGKYKSRYDIELFPVSQNTSADLKEYGIDLLSLMELRSNNVTIDLGDLGEISEGEYKWRLVVVTELLQGVGETSVSGVSPISSWKKFYFKPPPPFPSVPEDAIELISPKNEATVGGEVEFVWELNYELEQDVQLHVCFDRIGEGPMAEGFCLATVSGDSTSALIDLKYNEDFQMCYGICSGESYEWSVRSEPRGITSPTRTLHYAPESSPKELVPSAEAEQNLKNGNPYIGGIVNFRAQFFGDEVISYFCIGEMPQFAVEITAHSGFQSVELFHKMESVVQWSSTGLTTDELLSLSNEYSYQQFILPIVASQEDKLQIYLVVVDDLSNSTQSPLYTIPIVKC